MRDSVEPIKDPPSTEEMQLRMEKVRGLMQGQGLDYCVVAHTDNVYYLTNFAYIPFERPFFLIIPADEKPKLVVPLLEASHAEQRVITDLECHTYYEYPSPEGQTYADALRRLIKDDKRVGIESSLSLALKNAIPGKLIVEDIVDQARLIKTDYEVGRIAYSSSVVDVGLAKVLELSKPGVQELTIYSEGIRAMMAKVILEVPNVNMLASKFLCAVWPKALSAQPHSVPGLFDALDEGGPNITIVTAQADGYSAEVERTYFIGRVPEDAKEIFEVTMEARELAYELVKPGVHGSQVDAQVLKLIKDRGYGDHILHRTGHGFGITGHEPPWVALGSENILQKNMVISIEPGIYIPGKGGFRHSDTVLITENGCSPLTKSLDKLEDLILPVN